MCFCFIVSLTLQQDHSASHLLDLADNPRTLLVRTSHRELVRRARRDGIEARGMRKGRRERMRKGAIVSSSPQGMTSWSSSIKERESQKQDTDREISSSSSKPQQVYFMFLVPILHCFTGQRLEGDQCISRCHMVADEE